MSCPAFRTVPPPAPLTRSGVSTTFRTGITKSLLKAIPERQGLQLEGPSGQEIGAKPQLEQGHKHWNAGGDEHTTGLDSGSMPVSSQFRHKSR